MGLMDDADNLGKEVQQKRAIKQAAKEAAAEKGKAEAEELRRHEEAKKQGEI